MSDGSLCGSTNSVTVDGLLVTILRQKLSKQHRVLSRDVGNDEKSSKSLRLCVA